MRWCGWLSVSVAAGTLVVYPWYRELPEEAEVAVYKVNVSLAPEFVSEIDEAASDMGLTRSAFIAEASARYLAERDAFAAEAKRRRDIDQAMRNMRERGKKIPRGLRLYGGDSSGSGTRRLGPPRMSGRRDDRHLCRVQVVCRLRRDRSGRSVGAPDGHAEAAPRCLHRHSHWLRWRTCSASAASHETTRRRCSTTIERTHVVHFDLTPERVRQRDARVRPSHHGLRRDVPRARPRTRLPAGHGRSPSLRQHPARGCRGAPHPLAVSAAAATPACGPPRRPYRRTGWA